MKLIYLSLLALAAFVAIWMFFVVPAERRYHQRKLAALRQQIERLEGRSTDERPPAGN